MSDVSSDAITTFDRVIRLISVLIWPTVLATGIFIYRDSIRRVVHALVALAERADELKIWQLEIKRKVEKVAETTGHEIDSQNVSSIPDIQKTAAREIKAIVSTAPTIRSRDALRQSVRRRITAFASKYERVRNEMPAGKERTSAMNVITAQMRSLGLAGRPFLREFSSYQNSSGMRLAAIAILQVSPSSDYLAWLFERFKVEQPFIFFQASLAILQAVRKYGPRRTNSLSKRIEDSIKQVESFKGGTPDENTLQALRLSLLELKQMHLNKNLGT